MPRCNVQPEAGRNQPCLTQKVRIKFRKTIK